MSNGLIWAGLGKTIADVGGTIGGYMAQGIKDDEAERLLSLREAEAEKRQLALLDAREAKEQAKLDRDGLIKSEAEIAGMKAAGDRGFEKFTRDVGADTAMSPEELRAAYDKFYGDKEAPYIAKYSEERREVLAEIGKRGGSSKMIESAQNDVRLAITEEKNREESARKDMREERRYENEREDNKRAQAQLADQGRRTDALIARANRPSGDGKPEKPEKPPTAAALNTSISQASKEIAEAIGVAETEPRFNSRLNLLRKKAESGDETAKIAIETYEAAKATRNEARAAISARNGLSGGESKPSAATKSTATQSAGSPPVELLQEGKKTTFKNGQVWTLEGGKARRVS